MQPATLDAIRSHLARLASTATGLDAVLAEDTALVGDEDGQALAREVGRLAMRLEGLAEAAGCGFDPAVLAFNS